MSVPAAPGASPARDGDTRPDVPEMCAACDSDMERPMCNDCYRAFQRWTALDRLWLLGEVERLRAERDLAARIASEAVNAATLTSEAHARGILDPVDVIAAISRECLDNRAALAEVAARHQPYPLDDRALCRHCGREWPCADAVTAGAQP